MKKIFTFHGADHKCGCSMLSQCVAECIAGKKSDLNVLLVHAEESRGAGYSPKVRESMERIRPYLADRLLDVRDIVKKSGYKGNLSIIAGTDKPGSSEAFHPDMAEFFMGRMAQSFDIIICDSGANLEHGLSLGALFASDAIFMVFDQTESAFRRYEWLRPLYEKLDLKIEGFVLNKFTEDSAYTKEYARKRLKAGKDALMTVCGSQFGALAEIDEKSLLSYRDDMFRRDIRALSEEIMAMAGRSEPLRAANG